MRQGEDEHNVEVFALGPFVVHRNGEPCAVGGAKQAALLARLFVAQGRPVPVLRLCEELWDDAVPRNPVHALQARISRLRSALPSLTIEQVGNGYRLDPSTVRADIAQFETLREEGTWLLNDGLFHHAADRLRQALSIWRGPAFAEFTGIPSLQAEAVRLDTLWAATLADRIDIELAFGRESEVIPELASLVEHHELSERFWGQLMVACYRDDQVQEALDTYARAREIFSERFGAEPNSELGRLHVRILHEEPSASLLRFPVISDFTPASHRAPQTSGVVETSFTSQQTDHLVALIQRCPAVLVTGAAGLGKTHLLRSVRAHLEAQHYYAPLLSASVLGSAIPLGVFTGIAGSIAEDWQSAVEVIETFARHRSRTVVLVDNVDQLDDASLFVLNQLVTTVRVPVIMTVEALMQAPASIQGLYDSGELTEVSLAAFSEEASYALAVAMAGGPLTPTTRTRIIQAAAGNPWRLREVINGSKAAGQLVATDAGWELQGSPTPSDRLAERTGVRFEGLEPDCLESLMVIAIAGEYPGAALDAEHRRQLARANVLVLSDHGWLQLADQLDREVLRARCSEVMWADLTREAIRGLTSDHAAGVPQAQHRAQLLALDLNAPVDIVATIALAHRALGTFDERLALRAANAVITQQPAHTEAHRLAGIAASVLKMPQAAEDSFSAARHYAQTPMDMVKAAMDHAQHLGLRRHDATAAVHVIDETLQQVTGGDETAHLERARMRWMAIAGLGGRFTPPPGMPTDAASTRGLIEAGFSGVLTGPLDETHRVLATLQRVPAEMVGLVPGGQALIGLMEAMAVSYSGDVRSSMRMLQEHRSAAQTDAPESLGNWEYALGFLQLVSGDATKAYARAVSAVEYLTWRDFTGLLPAAHALKLACAEVTGQTDRDAAAGWDSIPVTAAHDPKVVILRDWTQARIAFTDGQPARAATILLDSARWLLTAQHTYFAAMCAHCAVRTGFHLEAALAVLRAAHTVAGGGLLAFFVRHAEATRARDHVKLRQLAREAYELGMVASAADTWAVTAQQTALVGSSVRSQHQQAAIDELYEHAPGLVSWVI